uniref:Ig-like domain-containing protein n=1 Tax=Neogobius melanostomus TaxID=47308 RepID=A0A8C6SJM4_9GOBI
ILISWNKGTANIVTSTPGSILISPAYEGRVTLNVLTGSLPSNRQQEYRGIYFIFTSTEPVTNVRITTNNTALVEFNDTVRLSCSASGSFLSFLWFNDSVEVTASDRVRITDGGATLTVVTVLRYDQGSYTCEVSNPVSSNTTDEELFVSYGPEGVRLTISPSAEYYGEGSVVSFSCSADSRPEAQFRWFINGEMSSSTGAQINLVMEQSGNYSCQAFNSEHCYRGTQFIFTPTEPVTNVRITANNTALVEFNDTVRLSCSASGSSLSFLWFNDSVEVTASDRVRITESVESATLTIVTVLRYDQGLYTCNVSNPVSSSNSSDEDVTLTISPSAEYYGEGSVVSFSCSADSRPEAQFRWFINGDMLSSTEAQINLVMEQSGNYSCQAFNSKTLRYTTSPSAEIFVLKIITNISFTSSSNVPMEGTSVNLTCDASGSIFTREWMINGVELKPSENIVFHEEKRVLSFRNLTREDSGRYTCRISNPVSSQSVDYTMNVNYGPDSVQISGPMEVQEGSTLKLSCSAESVPTAKYTWTKNGTTLTDYACLSCLFLCFYYEKAYINPCQTGCIVGIVFGCIAVILLISGGVFYALKKK